MAEPHWRYIIGVQWWMRRISALKEFLRLGGSRWGGGGSGGVSNMPDSPTNHSSICAFHFGSSAHKCNVAVRKITSAEAAVARVAMARDKLRLGSLKSTFCPRPPVIRGLLRLAQMQGVFLLYAVALAAALAVAGLECVVSLVLKRLCHLCLGLLPVW